jgi:hypothetical protein
MSIPILITVTDKKIYYGDSMPIFTYTITTSDN